MLSRPKNKDVTTHNQVPHLPPAPVKEPCPPNALLCMALPPKLQRLLLHSPTVLVREVTTKTQHVALELGDLHSTSINMIF